MVSAKIKYKTYKQKLLAIIETFKTRCHYVESYKYMVFILINYNNLYQSIDIKSLNFDQVY